MQLPVSSNTNLAYDDLYLFDDNRVKQTQQNQEKEQAKKQELKMSARSVSRSGSKLGILCTVGIAFALGCSVVYQNASNVDTARAVAAQQSLLEEAIDENALLQSKLDSIANIGYIEEYASNELGMSKVSHAQINYLSVNTEDLFKVESDGPDSFFDWIQGVFGDVQEYLGW